MTGDNDTPPGNEVPAPDAAPEGQPAGDDQKHARPARSGHAPHAAVAPGATFVPHKAIVLLLALVVVASALVLYSLWAFWPSTTEAKVQPQYERVNYFGWKLVVSRETLFFLAVALGGMLGGLIHTLRSISWYLGNRKLRWSWVPFYFLLPVIGALAGTVFYISLRAGLFSPTASSSSVSPYGFTAVALMAGLFSEQALEKLKELATDLFSERPQGDED